VTNHKLYTEWVGGTNRRHGDGKRNEVKRVTQPIEVSTGLNEVKDLSTGPFYLT
jgi:hypothetical protein